MNTDFVMPVCDVREGDRVYLDGKYRTVAWSRQLFGYEHEWELAYVKADEDWPWNVYEFYGKQTDEESGKLFWPNECVDVELFDSKTKVLEVTTDKVEMIGPIWHKPIRWFVAVYEVDRAYGGPEEGGWWFDCGTLRQVVPVETERDVDDVIAYLNRVWESDGNSSSVVYRGGDYRVSVHKHYPVSEFPTERPYYS